ncbi:MAG TPA: Xaa-Pro peptidase family protein [Candidatus Krumholzibacteria bacterium]|nr:Xaa-Pro peptidase family protein [Candidatus Krumholzibacteria bacterium]
MSRSTEKAYTILLYASSESDADVLYATRFHCPDPFIFIRTAAGKRIYVMSDLEIGRARSQSNAHRVLPLSRYAARALERTGRTPGVSEVMAEVLRELRIRTVTVSGNAAAAIVEGLRTQGVRVHVARGPLFPERALKTPAEVAAIRRAMRATEAGLQAAIDLLRSATIRGGWVMSGGRRLTAEALRRVLNAEVFARGCIPAHTIVAAGPRGCDPHDVGGGPIRAGQPIIIDVFPRSEGTGYFADITRTVVKGSASDMVRDIYQTVLDGQRMALRMIRHGVRSRDIHAAILDLFEARGFPTGEAKGRMQGFFHGTGHGLGLEIHEPPRIAMNDTVLKAGMVVTVEPGLYYHPVGGVRIEDTVLVTRTGIRNLTRLPKFLEIP